MEIEKWDFGGFDIFQKKTDFGDFDKANISWYIFKEYAWLCLEES